MIHVNAYPLIAVFALLYFLWGTGQSWSFSFDQTVDFSELRFNEIKNSQFEFESTAWVNDVAVGDSITGDNWTFESDGTVGFFSFTMDKVSTVNIFDFRTSGVSSVTADTEITLTHVGGDSGSGLESFTVSPIPEPASITLIGLGLLTLTFRRRRRRQ